MQKINKEKTIKQETSKKSVVLSKNINDKTPENTANKSLTKDKDVKNNDNKLIENTNDTKKIDIDKNNKTTTKKPKNSFFSKFNIFAKKPKNKKVNIKNQILLKHVEENQKQENDKVLATEDKEEKTLSTEINKKDNNKNNKNKAKKPAQENIVKARIAKIVTPQKPKTIFEVINDNNREEEINKQSFISKLFDKNNKPALELPKKKIVRIIAKEDQGLTKEQVQSRKDDDLANKTDTKFSKSYRTIILENVFTFFNMLCFVLAGFLIYFGAIADCLFLLVCIANMIIGLIQEIRAKETIDKLSLVTTPNAKVIRDGKIIEIKTEEMVLDDIVLLSNGKQICSDSIVINGVVEVNESLLTGESVNVKKEVGDRLFSGSYIVSGNCIARVDKVGKDNYVEILAKKAKKYKKPHSEILGSLNLAIKAISGFVVLIGILMLVNVYSVNGGDMKEAVRATSGSVIGMIPSGLFLLTSMTLAVSVMRLAKYKTLVQDLYCIETLARVNVLCLDKTGTITDGKMKVSEVVVLKEDMPTQINQVVGSMLACLGTSNQTNIALTDYFGTSKKLKNKEIIPFSSKRKYSAVTFSDDRTYVLGAPSFVMENLPTRIEQAVTNYALSGNRVLLLAMSENKIVNDTLPKKLEPVAIIVIEDHIREDAKETIKWFKDSDVDIKVISGDNPVAVSEIARRVGVINAEKYISLEGLSEAEVAAIANDYTVFGRVSPEQKAVLVKSMRVSGKIIAMTGDGVNDILAMKESNCAIAMAGGSEATRNVAHLVLLDSNFASMPKVVKEGRRVINNIKSSASLFLMKTFFTAFLSLFVLITHKVYPFSTRSMFMLETLIIGIGPFFLAFQPNNMRVQGKFLPSVIKRSLPAAMCMFLNIVALYVINNFYPLITMTNGIQDLSILRTMGVITVTFAGFISFTQVCQKYNWYKGILTMVILALLGLSMIYLTGYMELATLGFTQKLIVIIMIETSYPITMLLMWLFKRIDKLVIPKNNQN